MSKLNIVILLSIIFLLPLSAGEYSLEQVITLALENSDAVHMKALEMEQSRNKMNETRTSGMPSIDMKASFTLMSDPPEGIKIEAGSLSFAPTAQSQYPQAMPESDIVLMPDQEPTYFKITTTLTQPIFTWNKIENAIKISELDYFISGLSIQKTKEEIKKQISTLYFGLAMGQESLGILEKSWQVMTQILSDKDNSFNEGLINRQVVLEGRKNLIQMEAALMKSRQAWESGLESLKFFTGIEDEEIILTTPFRQKLPKLDEEELKTAVIESSTDLEILNRKRQQADSYVDIEKGSGPFRPDVSLVVSLDITGQEIPFVDVNWSDTWSSNLTVTLGGQMNIGDSGKSLAKIKKAETTLKMTALGIEQMEKGLRLQVRQAIEKVKSEYYSLLEKEASLELAREQYKNARVSFENDLITREEERGAQVMLFTKEMEHRGAMFSFENALLELEYLCGMEFPRELF